MKNKELSERRAARLVGASRTVLRYKRRLRDDGKLRRAIQRIAQAKRAYGYRMVWRKLRQQGLQVNHKCVYRIYREEKPPISWYTLTAIKLSAKVPKTRLF